jgi:hypothetical protein
MNLFVAKFIETVKCDFHIVPNRYSSFGITTGNGLDVPGSIPDSARFFSSPQRPDRLWGPPSLVFSGYWESFPLDIRRQGRKPGHSPPSSAEVKKGGTIPPHPYISLCHYD